MNAMGASAFAALNAKAWTQRPVQGISAMFVDPPVCVDRIGLQWFKDVFCASHVS
jgi:hypothetical protein